MEQGDHGDDAGDEQGAAAEAEAGAVGQVVAEGGAERVGAQDRGPVHEFQLEAGDHGDADRAELHLPEDEGRHEQRHQDERALGVTELEAAVHVVGDRRAGGAGRYDDRPVEGGHELPGPQLDDQRDQEHADEDEGADEVADIEGLGEHVAAGFTQRRGSDLHDPEHQRDLGKFGGRETRGQFLRHFGHFAFCRRGKVAVRTGVCQRRCIVPAGEAI